MVVNGLSYIVPAYNEEGAITSTIERLQAVLPGLGIPYEIIVVNDGSVDATRLRAEQCGSDVQVISHPVNIGYGSAIKTGIRASRYNWIGIVDADGTYPIENLPKLIEKMNQGFDMAVAARENVLATDRPVKRCLRWLMIALLNLIIGARVEDPNSGFRVFTRRLAFTFYPFLCNTFSFTTSMTVFALGERFFVAYVPLHYAVRTGRSKVRHFRDSLRMMQLIFQGITFFNPVKAYLMIILGLALGFLVPAVVLSRLGFDLAAVLWFAFGAVATILFGLGVLADIVRIAGIGRDSMKDC